MTSLSANTQTDRAGSQSRTDETASTRIIRKPACLACTQRKVKCDRTEPCQACRRTRLSCTYPSIADPARRKRKVEDSTQALLETIRQYEAKLREAGLPFEQRDYRQESEYGNDDQQLSSEEHNGHRPDLPSIQPAPISQPLMPFPVTGVNTTSIQSDTRDQPLTRGLLVPEYGGRRYYEYGLLGALAKDYKQELIDTTAEEALTSSPAVLRQNPTEILAAGSVLGPSSVSPSMTGYNVYEVTFKHWLVFAENVQPLTMILHVPTVQGLFTDQACTGKQSSANDAIRYAVAACAVSSLPAEACQSLFGEDKRASLRYFQAAANSSLQASSFMRVPTLELLQAYLLYLTSMIHSAEASTVWILFGSALRLAQSQGLHRDGSFFGLSAFETEMRRRLWWFVVAFDARLSELTGSESTLPDSADTPLPANLNDSDLSPEMTRLDQRTGATEMTFCLLKYEICQFIKRHHIALCRCSPRKDMHSHSDGPGEKRKDVGDLETLLQEKFLKFCDPVVPVHFLAALFARATLCKLTQMKRSKKPGLFRNSQTGLATTGPSVCPSSSSSESLVASLQNASTLKIATRNIEYDNLVHGTRALSGFLWHVHFYFPWGAPVFVLKDLAAHDKWDHGMELAWVRVQEMFANHPEYFKDEKVLHLVLGNLALKVWEGRYNTDGNTQAPDIIARLQATQISFWSKHADAQRDALSLFIPEGIWDPDLQYQQFFSGQFDYNAEPIMPSL